MCFMKNVKLKMKYMNLRWFLALSVVVGMSFSSCSKDDDKMTQDEMLNELLSNGNDRLLNGLKGDVKTQTTTDYLYFTWENNAVKASVPTGQYIDSYNQAGFLTSYISKSAVVTSIKWAKNNNNADVIVITGREMKPNYETTYTLDSKNRVTERISKSTSYETKIGGYYNISAYKDTILYSSISSYYSVSINDAMSSTSTTSYYKNITTYDDEAGTATVIESESDDGNTYEDVRKTVYKLNEYGRIDEDEYEIYETKSFEDKPTYKGVVIRDEKGNAIEEYEIRQDGDDVQVYYYRTNTYTYY